MSPNWTPLSCLFFDFFFFCTIDSHKCDDMIWVGFRGGFLQNLIPHGCLKTGLALRSKGFGDVPKVGNHDRRV